MIAGWPGPFCVGKSLVPKSLGRRPGQIAILAERRLRIASRFPYQQVYDGLPVSSQLRSFREVAVMQSEEFTAPERFDIRETIVENDAEILYRGLDKTLEREVRELRRANEIRRVWEGSSPRYLVQGDYRFELSSGLNLRAA